MATGGFKIRKGYEGQKFSIKTFAYDVLSITLSKCGYPKTLLRADLDQENDYSDRDYVITVHSAVLYNAFSMRDQWKRMFEYKQKSAVLSDMQKIQQYLANIEVLPEFRTDALDKIRRSLAFYSELILFVHSINIEVNFEKLLYSWCIYFYGKIAVNEDPDVLLEALFIEDPDVVGFLSLLDGFIQEVATPYGKIDDVSRRFQDFCEDVEKFYEEMNISVDERTREILDSQFESEPRDLLDPVPVAEEAESFLSEILEKDPVLSSNRTCPEPPMQPDDLSLLSSSAIEVENVLEGKNVSIDETSQDNEVESKTIGTDDTSQESEVVGKTAGIDETSQESEVVSKTVGRDEMSQESEVESKTIGTDETSQESEVVRKTAGIDETSQESEVVSKTVGIDETSRESGAVSKKVCIDETSKVSKVVDTVLRDPQEFTEPLGEMATGGRWRIQKGYGGTKFSVKRFAYDMLKMTLSKCGFPETYLQIKVDKENDYRHYDYVITVHSAIICIALGMRDQWKRMFEYKQKSAVLSDMRKIEKYLRNIEVLPEFRTDTLDKIRRSLAFYSELILFVHSINIEVDFEKLLDIWCSYFDEKIAVDEDSDILLEAIFIPYDDIVAYLRLVYSFIQDFAIPYGKTDDVSDRFREFCGEIEKFIQEEKAAVLEQIRREVGILMLPTPQSLFDPFPVNVEQSFTFLSSILGPPPPLPENRNVPKQYSCYPQPPDILPSMGEAEERLGYMNLGSEENPSRSQDEMPQ